jgi:hypothetical protein
MSNNKNAQTSLQLQQRRNIHKLLHISGLPGPSSGSVAVQNNSHILLSSPTCGVVVSSDNLRTRPRAKVCILNVYRRERLLNYVVP